MFQVKQNRRIGKSVIAVGMLLISSSLYASPSMSGQSGLIYMPDARIEKEGTFQFGVSHDDPYTSFWGNIAMMPWLELSARHIDINNLPSGVSSPFMEANDDSLNAKILLWFGQGDLPAIAIGGRDITGSRDFGSQYLVMSKELGGLDLSLGYGGGRIDGFFGGMRYRPGWNKNLAFVAEYDATDYKDDPFALLSKASQRKGKETFAVEYQRNWFGSQLSYQDGDVGINAYVSLPLQRSKVISNKGDTAPYTETPEKVTTKEWQADPQYKQRLFSALRDHGFKSIDVAVSQDEIILNVSHPRISKIGRAAGRAARIANALGPSDTKTIVVIYVENDLPLLSYRIDRHMFQRYLDGLISKYQLESHMEIHSPTQDDVNKIEAGSSLEFAEDDPGFEIFADNRDTIDWLVGDKAYDGLHFSLLNPGRYLSDSNGDFRYEVFSRLDYRHRLAKGLYAQGALRYRLLDNFDNSQASNSTLPHVRSDVSLYKQGSHLKLDSLLLNKFWQPSQGVYTRLSAGMYEEMYGGFGGQLLYLPGESNWAADMSLDWVKQRDYDGDFDFRDYDTVTSLASVHYQLPENGLSLTLRAGRFLAEDVGARLEMKRRFRSGIEVGFWYTSTDGDDLMSPGSIGDSYHDKGIVVKIPLSLAKGRDSRRSVLFSWSPAIRDVGQMVQSPGDLYELAEERLMLNRHTREQTSDFGQ